MKLVKMILPLSLLAVSGLAQDVRYNFDSASDFSKYKTYRWVQIKDAQPMDDMTAQQLKSAINAELMKKGLTEVQGEGGDLLVGYQVSINQEKEFNSYSTDFGYGGGWGRGWYGGGMGSTMTTGQTTTIHVGSVGLDCDEFMLAFATRIGPR